MRKLKIFFVTVVCLLASNIAFTLGVGDIKVSSALSEPLDAEIKLFLVRPGEGENIRVGLATLKEFENAGIDRPLELSYLKFKVVERGDGNVYIKVFSKRPIREPFLNFLLDIDWPSGRLLREYTLLLDPPIFSQRKAAPVQAPVVTAPARVIHQQPRVVVAPISTPLSVRVAPVVSGQDDGLFPHIQIDVAPAPVVVEEVAVETVVEVSTFSDDTYKVKKADTLWAIAKSTRPNSNVGISQMMLALQAANPAAFFNNNINGLKSGFVLRIPNLIDIQAINGADATRMARQQHVLWRAAQDNLNSAVTPSGTVTATSTDKQVAVTPKQQQASVKLVTPDANGVATAQGGGADSTDSSGSLVLAEEQLASKNKENDELQDRVQSLEDQIGSMERLLELKDDSIAALQNKLTTETLKPKPAAVVEPAPEPVVEKVAEPVVKEIVEDESKINPFALDNTAKTAVKPKSVPAPKKPVETSLLDDPSILAAILAALVAVLALVWLVMKRRQNNMQLPESILSSKPTTVSASSKADVSTTLLSDFAPSAMDGALESDSSEVDPAAEADVYIAYGKHQQAEELLLAAIEQEPERLDLRLKLMEVYHAAGNVDSFLIHANHLNGAMDDQNAALWDKAVVMGQELCPGNSLFGSGETADEDDFADLKGIADLDDDLELDIDKPTVSDDELSLDMEIDLEALDVSGEDDDLSLDLSDLTLEIEDDDKKTTTDQNVVAESDIDSGELSLEDVDEKASEEVSLDLADELDVDQMLEDADAGEDDDAMLGMDEVATKLDLAKAYIDMGDPDGARAILDEVLTEGSETQQSEAKGLIDQL